MIPYKNTSIFVTSTVPNFGWTENKRRTWR